VRFSLTDDQVAFRDAVRDLLAKESPDAESTYDALVAMGVTQVLVPEAKGGLGMDEVTATAILEEAGYAGVSFPIIGPVMGVDDTDDSSDSVSLGAAAVLVGLGQRMLDLTVDHVKAREQFGVPIGSFQAVKHHLANALMELSFARPAVHRAAWSMANGAPSTARDVSMAKAMASDAASFAGRQALQCHGAIGYTVEYDLHRFLKRTWVLARSHGDAAWHRGRIAGALEI
jgi:alkylation response protein AidB-like acyl-CoA dehydrogenase